MGLISVHGSSATRTSLEELTAVMHRAMRVRRVIRSRTSAKAKFRRLGNDADKILARAGAVKLNSTGGAGSFDETLSDSSPLVRDSHWSSQRSVKAHLERSGRAKLRFKLPLDLLQKYYAPVVAPSVIRRRNHRNDAPHRPAFRRGRVANPNQIEFMIPFL